VNLEIPNTGMAVSSDVGNSKDVPLKINGLLNKGFQKYPYQMIIIIISLIMGLFLIMYM